MINGGCETINMPINMPINTLKDLFVYIDTCPLGDLAFWIGIAILVWIIAHTIQDKGI